MNNSHQEISTDIHETEFRAPALSKDNKIIHFSSGETMELEDSEEEEQPSNKTPFREPAEKTRFSFKNVAVLVGRISLLACDFLGERLACALGLDAAKYQYAIDQYHRDHKTRCSRATKDLMEGQPVTFHLSPGLGGSHYGATGDVGYPSDRQRYDEKYVDTKGGHHNRSYQADEKYFK